MTDEQRGQRRRVPPKGAELGLTWHYVSLAGHFDLVPLMVDEALALRFAVLLRTAI